ncbi:cytochrome P450 [Poronia punctata]|nr:cytochrome P450 [Poronia punctata]
MANLGGLILGLLVTFLTYSIGEILVFKTDTRKLTRYPLVSTIWKYAPRFMHNLSYATNATRILEKGYYKFKSTTFQHLRGQGNVIVLPLTVLEELAAIPATVASPHGALEQDLLGDFTGLNLILESRIHHSIVQRKLTPRLNVLMPAMEDELRHAWERSFPDVGHDWTEFQPYQIFGKISASLTARALVGPELCRDEVWLDIAFNYTENLFRTIVLLRSVPKWMQSILCVFLPSYWNGKYYIRLAKQTLKPRIEKLLSQDIHSSPTEYDPATSNVLYWLAELAKGGDRSADKLAHIEVLLALASVHTTLLRMVNVLYDITASGPELVQELREEILEVLASKGEWTDNPYDKLHKLDSVMRESQRMSPPTIVGMKRLFRQDYTFSDGTTFVPKGSYACMPTYTIENDPAHTDNPAKYDGLRYYRQFIGAENEKEAEQFLFSSAGQTALNFGYGKSACPGRFFASKIIKMLFVKLLMEYDFQFLPGTGRPKNIVVHEFLFCWPWQKMLVRKRGDAVSVV